MPNEFMVGVQGENIVILRWQKRIKKDEALRLAAWLVVLSNDEEKFKECVDQVKNS